MLNNIKSKGSTTIAILSNIGILYFFFPTLTHACSSLGTMGEVSNVGVPFLDFVCNKSPYSAIAKNTKTRQLTTQTSMAVKVLAFGAVANTRKYLSHISFQKHLFD